MAKYESKGARMKRMIKGCYVVFISEWLKLDISSLKA
jgi:hypothetical protein